MKRLAIVLLSGFVLSACTDALEPERELAGVNGAPANTLFPEITMTNLGVLPGDVRSVAHALNDLGEVAGFSGQRAFVWRNGAMTDLGGALLGGPMLINNLGQVAFTPAGQRNVFVWQNGSMTDLGVSGTANAMNDVGQIVGGLRNDGAEPRHWSWKNGTVTYLDPLPGYVFGSEALAVSDGGWVVGVSVGDLAPHATLWQNGTAIDLDLDPASFSSVAVAVNNIGQVLVQRSGDFGDRSALWQNGQLTDLGTLGGNYTEAHALNNVGQVVGVSTTASGVRRDFIWQNGVMTDIGTLGGSSEAGISPLKINDLGQVTGSSMALDGGQHAFIWQNGVMTDLGMLGGASVALAINAAGQVAGVSSTEAGESRAVLWSTLRPATAAEEVSILTDKVNALVADGTLSHGQGQSLLSKLRAASSQIARGNTNAAANVLQAFITHVKGQVAAGLYPAATGQTLIDAAQAAIVQLEGGV